MSWLGISVATGAVVFRVTVILLAAASKHWVSADCNADGDVDSTDINGLAHHFSPRGLAPWLWWRRSQAGVRTGRTGPASYGRGVFLSAVELSVSF